MRRPHHLAGNPQQNFAFEMLRQAPHIRLMLGLDQSVVRQRQLGERDAGTIERLSGHAHEATFAFALANRRAASSFLSLRFCRLVQANLDGTTSVAFERQNWF
jgi:hypothetical protein